jgi:hypothetical protein
MSDFKNNPMTKGLSGKVGDTVVFRQWYGRTLFCNAPGSRDKIPASQQEQMSKFQRAVRYAKGQMAIPAMKAIYANGITPKKNNAYRVAVTDSLNPPVIHHIKSRAYSGKVGEVINIKATDDFRVTEVKVTIISGDGRELEKGVAERLRLKPDFWRYRTTVENAAVPGTVIRVKAYDYADNETVGEWKVGKKGD